MIRRLPQAPSAGLGAPTIMDRALAAEHGSPYVQLAVFAIDIDRIYAGFGDAQPWPFGWEVLLTEAQLLRCVAGLDASRTQSLLEDSCLSILDQAPDAQGLGSQLVFAAYDALERGALTEPLREAMRPVFRSWRSPPRQLLAALAEHWRDAERLIPELATGCLEQPLSPPLAAPVREALRALQAQPM